MLAPIGLGEQKKKFPFPGSLPPLPLLVRVPLLIPVPLLLVPVVTAPLKNLKHLKHLNPLLLLTIALVSVKSFPLPVNVLLVLLPVLLEVLRSSIKMAGLLSSLQILVLLPLPLLLLPFPLLLALLLPTTPISE